MRPHKNAFDVKNCSLKGINQFTQNIDFYHTEVVIDIKTFVFVTKCYLEYEHEKDISKIESICYYGNSSRILSRLIEFIQSCKTNSIEVITTEEFNNECDRISNLYIKNK